MSDIINMVRARLAKTSFLMVVVGLLVGGLFIGKAYGGGPGACDDGVPDAFFTVQPTSKAVGELNASLNGNVSVACNDPIVSYEWDFGDGTTGSGVNVSHHYGVGTYYPSLTITDAAGLSDTDTTQSGIVVKADNQNPVLTDAIASVLQAETTTVDMSGNGSDPDGDDVSRSYYLPQDEQWGSNFQTEKGYVQRYSDAGIFTYRAQQGASGQDTFQVGIRDGFGGTAIATVTVTIPQRVTAVADTATTQENTDVTIPVTANDESYQDEPFEIYWTSLSTEAGFVVSVDKAAGTITYHPNPGFVGTAQFEYGIKSLVPNSWWISQTQVEVQVTPAPNHAPVANNDTFTLSEDTPSTKNLLSNDSDSDGDPLAASLVTGPQHGTATLHSDGTLSYTPDANYNGTDSVTYRVTDDDGLTDTATVALTITAVNDAPQAAFTWNVQTGGNVSFNAGGSSDIDNAVVSYHWSFGDGESQTATTPTTTHKYKGKGTKVVTLKITDVSGAQTTLTQTITL